jgi:hypothetical protein
VANNSESHSAKRINNNRGVNPDIPDQFLSANRVVAHRRRGQFWTQKITQWCEIVGFLMLQEFIAAARGSNCTRRETILGLFKALSCAIPLDPRTMPDTGSASGESSQPSEGIDYRMRRRNEPAPDEGGLTDSISMILKELRLKQKEMASNKTEFEEKLAMIKQIIRSTADQDTASSVKTASKETVERMDGRATEAQPKAGTPETGTPETGTPETGTPETGTPETGTPETGTPETGGMVIPLGVTETRTFIFKWRQKRYMNVSKWAVVASTLRL